MTWVGILTVKGEKFFVNGRLIASSLVDFYNHCCFHQMPRTMMIFFSRQTKDHEKIAAKMSRFFDCISYHQIKPCIYIHQQKKRYVLSISIGIILSSIWWGVVFFSTPFNSQGAAQPLANTHYHRIMDWVQHTCPMGPCIQRMGIFPHAMMIEFKDQNRQLQDCKRYNKRGYVCLNEHVFMP